MVVTEKVMSSSKYFTDETKLTDCESDVDIKNTFRALSDIDSSPSVREFLEQERQCTEDNDFNIDNIFDQINKLQNASLHKNNKITLCNFDNENIEEILSQAEKLVKQTSKENSGKSMTKLNFSNESTIRSVERHLSTNTNSIVLNSLKTFASKQHLQNKDCDNNHSKQSDNLTGNNGNSVTLDEPLLEKGIADMAAKTDKDSSIYELKQSLSEVTNGREQKKQKLIQQDEAKNLKLINSLQEELKEKNERLHSIQMLHDNLADSSRLAKNVNEELLRDNKFLEIQLNEKDGSVEKLRKDMEALKLDKSRIDLTESKFKEEIAHCKEENKNRLIQSSKDQIKIQDLQRQCKEMEGILARRHPDSVSALIVASKHPTSERNTKTLLENRISFLENELKDQENKYQLALTTVHEKVNSMKCNYETHIGDLENQVVNLQHINSELKEFIKPKNARSVTVQTEKNTIPIAIQTQIVKPTSAKCSKAQPPTDRATSSLGREDSHSYLIATVRGLTTELSQKEKTIARLGRELDDVKRLILKLQKDKEANFKGSSEKVISKKNISKASTARSTKSSNEALNSRLKSNKENEVKKGEPDDVSISLRKDLTDLQSDYERLKKKRIEDLFALQTAHEKELSNLNVKVMPLQDDVSTLNTTVELLHNQIKLMDEQLSVIVTERDHYKHRAELLNSKLNFSLECPSDRSTKSNTKASEKDYSVLKFKVAELEKRYEGRELRLKTLVDSLARLKDSQFQTASLDSGHCTDRLNLPGQYPY